MLQTARGSSLALQLLALALASASCAPLLAGAAAPLCENELDLQHGEGYCETRKSFCVDHDKDSFRQQCAATCGTCDARASSGASPGNWLWPARGAA